MEFDLGFPMPPSVATDLIATLRSKHPRRANMTPDALERDVQRAEMQAAVASNVKIPFVQGLINHVDRGLLSSLDVNVLRKSMTIPVIQHDNRITVAVGNPFNMDGVDHCRHMFAGSTIVVVMAPIPEIERGYGAAVENTSAHDSAIESLERIDNWSDAKVFDISEQQHEAVIEAIRLMFEDAVSKGATDIHLWCEMGEKGARLRRAYRINGILRHHVEVPDNLVTRMDAVLMSQVGVPTEKARTGVPISARLILATSTGRKIACRYERTPAHHGYHITLRLQDQGDMDLVLGKGTLSFPEPEMLEIDRSLEASDGLIMISGATGSGKTTTLAAMLNRLAIPEELTCTVEDPVEREVRNVIHQPLKEGGFTSMIRSLVRSDPDNIMVGEIRDGEECKATMNLAITGHLVLTTIHSVSAADILSRCRQWGVPIFDLIRTLRLLMAQRLVELVCENEGCRKLDRISDREMKLYKLTDDYRDIDIVRPIKGNMSCPRCGGVGYSRRTVIAEVIPFDDELCSALTNPETIAGDVERHVRERHKDLKSLKQHGLDLIKQQKTDLIAVKRVVNLAHSTLS
jgi:Type II secretory pathway, ATPase PulE/Tfp pilus assembly pathway, ATPase PilB